MEPRVFVRATDKWVELAARFVVGVRHPGEHVHLDGPPQPEHGVRGQQSRRALRRAVAMRGELRLRFDYGRITPWIRAVDGGVDAATALDRTSGFWREWSARST